MQFQKEIYLHMTTQNTAGNKKYMIIAVSAQIAEFTARNNGGAARQESNPQSATTYISVRYQQYKQTPSR
jgi:hypothetical protein